MSIDDRILPYTTDRIADFAGCEKLSGMREKKLRITKRAGSSPAIAVCELCGKQFKVPITYLSKIKDAQASLQEQFDRHKCSPSKTLP
jgi:hypothetical protein